MESVARGGTRWKRFALVMVPSVAATAAIGIGLAQGALAASFTVSGQQFKVRAGYLEGYGFSQYGGVDVAYKGTEGDETVRHPVSISSFKTATIRDMCQSVVTDVPFVGKVTMRMTAGEGREPVKARNLYLDIAEFDGNATFDDIDIGVAVKDTDGPSGKGPDVKDGSALENGFAQQARRATLTNVEQVAWATTAGSFSLAGLKMRLHRGDGPDVECF
ncbi:DUF6230 family protein [Streptomyces clavuligerus]|uniref:Uncharacterized protein n=1 Tax=Streptomyces clavuligerus TaxID=1901 RepID=B5GL00_STRCL|nr:DUF6230 family protein [Streptomyces clavuligerus]ANW18024.1 cholesterol esterase [Streptomyces clavuligerus]AXU12584.1 cholesterol esterase [Streptomyces clavuligerus]EDY46996.1 cholesterol esterase [Streptomyces clavuligerus]EFG09398.1 Hypothetical protein SCLAV_4325 [Streptomyces clavuligerus]MBY6302484.1 cholesterol esterase [Streptomyces clavuligerus]